MQKTLQPPQPIPYPKNPLIKKLYKTPILLYRLGLFPMFARYILILSTTGRKSGKTRHTPVEYFHHQGRFYIISGFDKKPDWYKNIQADPHVTLQTRLGTLHAIARAPQTDEEWQGVAAYLQANPISNLFFPEHLQDLKESETMAMIKSWPALTFEETSEPCPPALEMDLVWALPLILLGMAIDITLLWFFGRES
jgi:deazaflavin-dependent oxidoreductase (nitroreductase family)